MALDEVLWTAMAPDDPPIVCIHSIGEESVTLGFAQTADELSAAGLAHLPWTRRLTGGGAIHHGDRTISFSVMGFGLTPDRRPGPVAAAFGELLSSLWKQLGLETRVVCCDEGSNRGVPLCADRLYPGDVMHGERKVAGIGQRHRRGKLLVQAALMGDRSPFAPGDPLPALREAVRERFSADLAEVRITPEQRKVADELQCARYLSDAWRLERK